MKASEIVPFSPTLIDLIRRVLSVAETDAPVWNPGQTYIYSDGKGDRQQATVGIGFTADGGNLLKMLQMYVDQGGSFGPQFGPWIAELKAGSPCVDLTFRTLVKAAGKEDPLFMKVQEQAFDDLYLGPAFQWGKNNGFALPLSYLVIADSFLHSGSILSFLRNKFPEKVPKDGGEEKAWVSAYLETRRDWLATHPRRILHSTVYRADCYLEQITLSNWDLARTPIVMNGTRVFWS